VLIKWLPVSREAGHTVVASVLLNRRANPNAADDSGNTAASL